MTKEKNIEDLIGEIEEGIQHVADKKLLNEALLERIISLTTSLRHKTSNLKEIENSIDAIRQEILDPVERQLKSTARVSMLGLVVGLIALFVSPLAAIIATRNTFETLDKVDIYQEALEKMNAIESDIITGHAPPNVNLRVKSVTENQTWVRNDDHLKFLTEIRLTGNTFASEGPADQTPVLNLELGQFTTETSHLRVVDNNTRRVMARGSNSGEWDFYGERLQRSGSTSDLFPVLKIHPASAPDSFDISVTYEDVRKYETTRLSAFYLSPADFGQRELDQVSGSISWQSHRILEEDLLYSEWSPLEIPNEMPVVRTKWESIPPDNMTVWFNGDGALCFEYTKPLVIPVAVIYRCTEK